MRMAHPRREDRLVYPSTYAVLLHGISCCEAVTGGWSVYWMEGGSELTLFPGDEGPQEASDVEELLSWIGGDQPCVLTPAGMRQFDALPAEVQRRLLTVEGV